MQSKTQPKEAVIRRPSHVRLAPAALVGLVVILGAAGAIATTHNSDSRPTSMPELLQKVGFDGNLNASLPLDVTLRDESGQPAPLGQFFDGKPIVLAFVYFRCPMLCNLTMEGLAHGLSRVPLDAGKDFTILLVSIDSAETPARAAAARRRVLDRYNRDGADSGWRCLTGEQQEVRRLADAVGFRYEYDASTDQYAHAAGVTIVTPDGVVSRCLYGVDFPPRDLRLALIDASQGGIGSPTDRVLLLCFHYDPITGKYGLAVIRLLQVGGAATVLVMAGAIGLSLIGERRRARAASVDASIADPHTEQNSAISIHEPPVI